MGSEMCIRDSLSARLIRATVSFAACLFLAASTLKVVTVVQESCEHRHLRTFTIPSSACCLQYAAFSLSTLKLAHLVQESWEQWRIAASGWGDETHRGLYKWTRNRARKSSADLAHTCNSRNNGHIMTGVRVFQKHLALQLYCFIPGMP